MKNKLATVLAAALFFAAAPSIAQQGQPAATQSAQAAFADAEVRKVDKSRGRITLKHGEIKSLDMPAMTMVFGVKDTAMLDQVKAGDKIRFAATNQDGKFTVTEIQPAK
jgi:Cu/Ag efflux protein CusF